MTPLLPAGTKELLTEFLAIDLAEQVGLAKFDTTWMWTRTRMFEVQDSCKTWPLGKPSRLRLPEQ